MKPSPDTQAKAALDERSAIDAIRRIVRTLRESSRAAEKAVGLSGAQVFVLHALHGERALSLNEIAARTLTNQSSVSVVVSRLVEQGLVRRVRARDDARRLELALTPKGTSVVARVPFVEQQRLVAGLRKLTPARIRMLARSLEAWVAAMGLEENAPSMFFEEPARRPPRPRTSAARVARVAPASKARRG